MHMTCRACRHHFCWHCLAPWALHGQATGGSYLCNRSAAAEAEAAETAGTGTNGAARPPQQQQQQQQQQQGGGGIVGAMTRLVGLWHQAERATQLQRQDHYRVQHDLHKDPSDDRVAAAVLARMSALAQVPDVGPRLPAAPPPSHPWPVATAASARSSAAVAMQNQRGAEFAPRLGAIQMLDATVMVLPPGMFFVQWHLAIIRAREVSM